MSETGEWTRHPVEEHIWLYQDNQGKAVHTDKFFSKGEFIVIKKTKRISLTLAGVKKNFILAKSKDGIQLYAKDDDVF